MNDSSTTAGCVLLLIDESAAMAARAAGSEQSLAAQTATAVNALLNQMASGPNVPIAVIGYHGAASGDIDVSGRFGGIFAQRNFVPLRELLAVPVRVETRIRKSPTGPMLPPREEPVAFPIWYEPKSGATGPQIAAFEHARTMAGEYLTAHPGAPVLVIHVCAAASSDGSPHQVVQELMALGDTVQVFHAHLGTAANVPPTLFPANRAYLPIGMIRDTFDRASLLPQPLVAFLKQVPLIINPGARGLIANAKLTDLIRMLSLVKETVRAWPETSGTHLTIADVPLHVSTTPLPVESSPTMEEAPVEPSADGVDTARLLAMLIDRSVTDPFNGDPKNAYSRLQERANELLTRFAAKPDPNLHLALVVYGLDSLGLPEIRTGFDGALANRAIVPAAELAAGALRTETTTEQIPNGIGGLIEVSREKLTFLDLEPTRSCTPVPAFEALKPVLDSWQAEHGASQPMILHLTRGGQAEGELREAVGLLGNAAIFHLVATEEPHASVAYPESAEGIEDATVRLLTDLSSPLSESFADHPAAKPGSRGIVVNGKFEFPA